MNAKLLTRNLRSRLSWRKADRYSRFAWSRFDAWMGCYVAIPAVFGGYRLWYLED